MHGPRTVAEAQAYVGRAVRKRFISEDTGKPRYFRGEVTACFLVKKEGINYSIKWVGGGFAAPAARPRAPRGSGRHAR
jgi:hypothetical protein